MNGILVVNKPAGMTSFDVVAKLRKVLNVKRIGHTGTLDPDAEGVLPVCVGKATGAVEYLMSKDKKYRVVMHLGITTDTGDASGKVLEVKEVQITEKELEAAILCFIGKISQVPPMYSALKVQGKKLYTLARQGITVERKPRNIEIFDIHLIGWVEDRVVFDVTCSKGTYIRTLCEDIGSKLGCGAHLACLSRMAAGPFKLENALTLDEIRALADQEELKNALIPVEQVLESFRSIQLTAEDKKRFLNGVPIVMHGLQELAEGEQELLVRVYHDDLFLGMGRIIMKEEHHYLRSKKLFIDQSQ